MTYAMKFDGKNAHAICAWATGQELKPHELAGGFWLKQLSGPDALPGDEAVTGWQLAAPAKNGEVYLDEGDFLLKEDDGELIRLSPDQMRVEHPELFVLLS